MHRAGGLSASFSGEEARRWVGKSLTNELSNYLQDFSHTQLKQLWATRTTDVHWK